MTISDININIILNSLFEIFSKILPDIKKKIIIDVTINTAERFPSQDYTPPDFSNTINEVTSGIDSSLFYDLYKINICRLQVPALLDDLITTPSNNHYEEIPTFAFHIYMVAGSNILLYSNQSAGVILNTSANNITINNRKINQNQNLFGELVCIDSNINNIFKKYDYSYGLNINNYQFNNSSNVFLGEYYYRQPYNPDNIINNMTKFSS